jgi:hypothetical protein
MVKVLMVILLGFWIGLHSFAQDKGLIGYWQFDEGKGNEIKDSSGNDIKGRAFNIKWVKGIEGYALEFKGNGYVDCGKDKILDITDAITIEVWIKPYEWLPGEYYGIVGKFPEDTYKGWALYYAGYNNQLEFRVNINDKVESVTSPPPTLQNWHHIVGTYDGKELKLFIDGICKASKSAEGKIATNDRKLIIGRLYDSIPQWGFKGIIDEVKIYNYALPVGEIVFNYISKGGELKKEERIVKVRDYPASLFVSDSGVKIPKEGMDWIYNCRAFVWTDIPRGITLEQARKMAKSFFDRGVNVIFPEGYRYLFVAKEDEPNWFNSPTFEEYLRDLKTITQACHEYGIKVVGHLTCCCVLTPYFRAHPDQAMIDMETGKPAYYEEYETYMMCPNNPDFRRAYLGRIEELLKETGFDGLMVDETEWLPPKWSICGCKYCREKFKKETGYEVPQINEADVWGNFDNPRWRAWIDFRIRSMGDFLVKIKEVLNRFGKDKLFTGCYCDALYVSAAQFYGMDLEDMGRSFNTFFYECEPCNPWSWRYNIAEARYYLAFGPTFYLGYSNTKSQQFYNWAFAKANGLLSWIWPFPPRNLDIFPYQWEKKWEDIFLFAKPLCNIAICFSSPTKNLTKDAENSVKEYIGWAEALLEEHIPYETIIASRLSKENLKKYSTVILADTSCLSEREIETLKEYVKEGGKLIATYESSLFDEKGNKRGNFGLGELIGLNYRGNTMFSGHLSFSPSEIAKDIGKEITYKAQISLVEKMRNDVAVLGKFKETNTPAVTLSTYGKGKVLYFAFRPGIEYFMPKVGSGRIGEGGIWQDTRNPECKKLMVNTVLYKTSLPLYTENIPIEVIVNPYIHQYEGYKGVSIHLLNLLGAKFKGFAKVPADANYEFLAYPSPKNYIPKGKAMKIKVKAEGVKNAYLISPDFEDVMKLKFYVKDGYCEVEVPDLGRYEVIYLVQGDKDLIKERLGRQQIVEKFPPIQQFLVEEEKAESNLIRSRDFVGGKLFEDYPDSNKTLKDGMCIYGSKTSFSEMVGTFYLEKVPSSLSLEICALSLKAPTCRIEILINNNPVFSGDNEFSSLWSTRIYPVNTKYLKKGINIITIKNLEDTGKIGVAPWFMVNYVRLKSGR